MAVRRVPFNHTMVMVQPANGVVPQVPALVWDDKLAASAKAWADGCQFAVSGTPGVGEALGFGYATFTDAVNSWYKQVGRPQLSLTFSADRHVTSTKRAAVILHAQGDTRLAQLSALHIVS